MVRAGVTRLPSRHRDGVQYLFENDLGAGRLCWKAGSIIEDVHLMNKPEDFEVVTEQFYALVERAH